MRRQLRRNGGIMNAVPRQGYFLGSIGKAVGKVFDVGKQIVKSPVGKAALIGLGGAGLMGYGPMSGLGARIGGSGIGQFFKGMGPKLFGTPFAKGVPPGVGGGFTQGILGKLGLTKGGGSMIPTALGMISSASLLGYFVQKGATEEEAEKLAKDVYRGKGLGMDQIRADMQKYRSGALSASQAHDKGYHFLTPRNYLSAQGGRVGLYAGTQKKKKSGSKAPGPHKKTKLELLKKEYPTLFSDTTTSIEGSPQKKKYTKGRAQGGRIGYQAGSLSQTGVIPGFTKLKDPSGFPGTYNEFMYRGPDGQTYGAQTYSSISAGMYPNIYDPASTPVAEDKSLLNKAVGALTGEHFGAEGNREKLLDAMDRGLIDEKEYKLMSGYDARKEMGMTPVQTLQSSGIYNVAKGVVSPEDFEEGIGPIQSTILNAIGSTGYGFDKDKFSGILDLSSEALSEDPYASSYGSQIAQKVGGAPAYDEMTPGMQAAQVKGLDPRMGRSYQENIQAMADPRMRGPMGAAQGGRIGKFGGGIGTAMPRIPTGMPRVNAGGITELDYRQEGGYVPMGVKEKADDVPAMLSKNEFVMTADAVKGAGGGSVEKGAQRMYDTMKRLEGRVA